MPVPGDEFKNKIPIDKSQKTNNYQYTIFKIRILLLTGIFIPVIRKIK